MYKRLLPLVLFTLAIVPAATAHAQERGQTGIAMGYPTNIALIWHASDKLAIRPDLNFTHSSFENESSFPGASGSSDNWTVTVGASALWYMAKTDNIRTYFSPRLAFGRSSADTSSNTGDPHTSNQVSFSGSFGAQYAPVRKFNVFGEVGYGFNRASSKFETPFSTLKTSAWNTSVRTAVGVIFYFGRS